MHFSHISAKIQLKNLKQHFDWGSRALCPLGYALGSIKIRIVASTTQALKLFR